MSIRISELDAHSLCNDYMHRNLTGNCSGCRLLDELDKPVKERSKAFLKRIEPAVIRLRKMNRNKD